MRSPEKQAQLFVHGSLNDFLGAAANQKQFLVLEFELSPSIKDLLEARGIPHTEIFKLTVNGRETTLKHRLQDGDTMNIYPISRINKTEIEPVFISPSAFIADNHLNKLARYLRLLGIDTQVAEHTGDEQIISRSNENRQMILTRDIGLLKHGDTRFGYWIRSTDPDKQLYEVLERFDLHRRLAPFSRCMECNGLLQDIRFETIKHQVPPYVRENFDDFFQCQNCKKIYWKGSHYEKLMQKADKVLQQFG